jgi:Uncharacterised protein family (UPF0193)
VEEISERRQWLDDMVALGREGQYKDQIRKEIKERLSRLRQLAGKDTK